MFWFALASIIIMLPLAYGLATFFLYSLLQSSNLIGNSRSATEKISSPISYSHKENKLPQVFQHNMYEPTVLEWLNELKHKPEYTEALENELSKDDLPILSTPKSLVRKPKKSAAAETAAPLESSSSNEKHVSWKDAIINKK